MFLYQLFVILLTIFGCFWEFIFQKLVRKQLFGWEFCVVQLGTVNHHKGYEPVNFYKKSRLYLVGRSVRDGLVTTFLQFAQIGTFQTKFHKIYFFYEQSQPLIVVLQEITDTLEFVRGGNLELLDS